MYKHLKKFNAFNLFMLIMAENLSINRGFLNDLQVNVAFELIFFIKTLHSTPG